MNALRHRVLSSYLLVVVVLFVACAAPAATPADDGAAVGADSADGTTATAATPVVTWYYFDQNNTDPQANERVGNFYLARTIPLFNEAFAGQYEWVNVPRDYNLVLDLVTAVQNNGEIPDLMRTAAVDMPTFLLNNTVQDLTDFVQNATWYDAIDPAALAACTGPDGNIYCVPVSSSPYVNFYWTERYPDGFPATTDAFLTAAEALKQEGHYALTYWGSTAFDGEAAGRYFYQVISSFGGSYDDGAGNMLLNTPENIAAIEFMRTIVEQGYSSESVFVGNFEEEAVFKIAEAGAFPTGFFVGYQYINPLTAPNGTVYETATAEDMENAVKAGDIDISPLFAPAGMTPGCHLDVFGFVIPNGANNVEGAQAYINWIMEPEQGVDWVLSAGGGIPVVDYLAEDEAFQTEIFQKGAAAAEASDCQPWYGSLQRIPEAKVIITNVIFDLIKGDPTAEISPALTAAQEEYNADN
ncbi:MAG: extracellular solute-binding protein [Caldilineaceae bacterium]|nr:extracellular solute-binding protein [Caldilineaceae bacterium]